MASEWTSRRGQRCGRRRRVVLDDGRIEQSIRRLVLKLRGGRVEPVGGGSTVTIANSSGVFRDSLSCLCLCCPRLFGFCILGSGGAFGVGGLVF
jgi:hypothetical protein